MYIDLAVVIVLLLGLYHGYQNGIIRTLASVLSSIIALLVAIKWSPYLADWAEDVFKSESALVFLLSFALLFLLVIIIIRGLARLLEKSLKTIRLNIFNRIAGAILMALLYVFLLSLIIWVLDKLTILGDPAKADSIFYPIVRTMPDVVLSALQDLKPYFSAFWEKINELIDPDRANKPLG